MRKLFGFLILSISAVVFSLSFVFAQQITDTNTSSDNPTRSIAYGSICLRPVEFAQNSCPENRPEGVNCSMPVPDSDTFPSGLIDHAVRVKNTPPSKFPLDQDIYIVGCVFENDSFVCSTGRNEQGVENEKAKNELANLGFLVSSGNETGINHYFELKKGLSNPIQTKDGNLDLIIRSYTPNGTAHAFFGIYEQRVSNIGDGSNRTPQLEQIDFKQMATDCADIFWDPEGYVFDAKTLMPISGVNVYLYSVSGLDTTLVPERPGFLNPYMTSWDGAFFFYVEPAIYTLDIQSDEYEFPVDISEVNPLYKNSEYGYKCDVAGYDLYTDRLKLDETKGKMIRCDIPLKSKNEQKVQQSRSYLIYNQALTVSETKTKVSAYVWPLNASFSVVQENEEGYQTVLATARAKRGGFTVVINNSLIDPQLPLYIIPSSAVNKGSVRSNSNGENKSEQDQSMQNEGDLINKIKIFLSGLFNFKVTAEANNDLNRFSARPMYPVLNYIEGVAYDDLGNPIANAEVKIIDKGSNKEILRVTADENGYFKIPPAYLPMFEYYLNIDSADGRTFAYTTSEFVRMNKAYLDTAKLDLLRARRNGVQIPEFEEDNGQVIITADNQNQSEVVKQPSPLNKDNKTDSDKNKEDLDEDTQSNQGLVVAVILLLFVLSAIGLVMILYIYKLRKLDGEI
ncbi:MAG: hypothetical protein KatS3mg090_0999 [Patescibacteria group bacterium]|nr:MAG: hypothetical protein KatS3mg090_0999 [Patescibacteria group bacterium]